MVTEKRIRYEWKSGNNTTIRTTNPVTDERVREWMEESGVLAGTVEDWNFVTDTDRTQAIKAALERLVPLRDKLGTIAVQRDEEKADTDETVMELDVVIGELVAATEYQIGPARRIVPRTKS